MFHLCFINQLEDGRQHSFSSHLYSYAGTECSVLSETEFLFVLTWPRKMADYNLDYNQS